MMMVMVVLAAMMTLASPTTLSAVPSRRRPPLFLSPSLFRAMMATMAIAPAFVVGLFFAQRLPSMAAAATATGTSIPGGRAPPIFFRIIASHISCLWYSYR